MLVYGDQETKMNTHSALVELRQRRAALSRHPYGVVWHQACVALFIAAAGLAQGLIDAVFATEGEDTLLPDQVALLDLLREIGEAVDNSWCSAFTRQEVPALAGLERLDVDDLPSEVTIRRCEGFAFYALYPEQYLAAARALPRRATVIGLRSIGTGLAALVAGACCADLVCTVRPIGDVYARTVKIGAHLEEQLRARRNGVFVLVDEGPGQSGSSFGGVADYLEGHGVERSRIIFMPSHTGNLGWNAQPSHRQRWSRATRLTVEFEHIFFGGGEGAPFATWFEDITGAASAPMRDLSGGQWRSTGALSVASFDPGREARKYLLEAEHGTFLLKFIGLDAEASAKFDRARQLHAAGFTPEPLGVRYGFLVERWMAGTPPTANSQIWPLLGKYINWRADAFRASEPGASLQTLVSMARFNLEQAFGSETNALFEPWPQERVAALQPHVQPVHVDGRMHSWEWIATETGVLKTDAIDHAQSHDLIGCQDAAWDVAGALVELSASKAQEEDLLRAVVDSRVGAVDLTALLTLCYLGFQVGWWDFSSDEESAARQRRFYGGKIADLLGRST